MKVINHYQVNHQLKKLSEECFEFIEAVFQYEAQKEACENIGCSRLHIDKCKEHIIEELSDVWLLLNEFKEYYEISYEEIDKMMKFKLARTISRMEEECKKNGEI